MSDFPVPDFISEQSADTIHQRMLQTFPDDIDVSEGQFPWDSTRPAALEIAYASEYVLVEALKTIMPKYSSGENLDDHAEANGLSRKEPTFATGTITVTGTAGTVIPLGSVFSTESTINSQSIDFITLEAATISTDGTVDIPVTCTTAGANGNVAIGTIVLKSSDLPSAITSVTNSAATTGGTDAETDEALRERIAYVEQSKGVSYVGSKADYKRWAESIDGVGEAKIISATDDSGTVTIILTDATGAPASSTLCTAVYNYIMGVQSNQEDRLANVNASLVVKAPDVVSISVTGNVVLNDSATISDVSASFLANLNKYLLTVDAKIKYVDICEILYKTDGVEDYSNVLVNDATANIAIDSDEIAAATASTITLTAVTSVS